jgi:hypothetical protein
MIYILAILGLLSVICVKKLATPKNIHDLKEVRNLMATRYPEKSYTNTIRIYWATFVTVNKYYFHHLLRSLDQSVEIKDRNTAILSYTYKGNDYKIAISTRTGPCVIESVLNEKGENVTDIVLPYFGPGRDWHGKVFYPKWWGYEILEFIMHTGNTVSFRGKEEISF